jgi:putative restriction endonuclease
VQRHGEILSWNAIGAGFEFNGERILFANRAVGIFKPALLNDGAPLSLRTSRPSRSGREAVYEDLASGDGVFHYKFQGDDPDNHHNRMLRKAWEEKIPLIYFYGLSDATYQAIYPVFVVGFDRHRLEVMVSASLDGGELETGEMMVADPILRRYRTQEVKARLHQSAFRLQVLRAYDHRCALTRLPVVPLLDAVHILPDREKRGHPSVPNGLCMSKLHHSAYDANILGIDPDGVVHVNQEILNTQDGPLLEGLKALSGTVMSVPRHEFQRPCREFLAERFEQFRRT